MLNFFYQAELFGVKPTSLIYPFQHLTNLALYLFSGKIPKGVNEVRRIDKNLDFLRFQDDKNLQANFLFYCPVDFITRGIAFICYILLFYTLFFTGQ